MILKVLFGLTKLLTQLIVLRIDIRASIGVAFLFNLLGLVLELGKTTLSQVLNLFMELRENLNLTYLFISHDLGVVEHLSDRVVIMYLGRVVESTTTDALFEQPNHQYTPESLDYDPEFVTREIQGATRAYFLLYANARQGFGAVTAAAVYYRSLLGWLYCPGLQTFYKVRIFRPQTL